MPAPKSDSEQVSAYIAAAPKPARAMLRELRRTIRAAAPEAIEKLSYGMPYYHHHGRLTYFAAFTKHVSLFVMGRSKLRYAATMKRYQTSASTLRFLFGSKLPVRLVTNLVRARVRENEAAR